MSELREAIGAAKRSGIRGCCKRAGSRGDRPRSHKLLGGCDIKQLPRVEIGLSDDRQQVRMLATSLAATVAPFAGAVLAATGGAAALSESYRGRYTWGLGRDHS